MEHLLEYLKNTITNDMTLEEIVNIFEKMCQAPVDEDMILFETGTYNFTGEKLFYFSLVRQCPSEDDEFYQLHVDILYKPSSENAAFNTTVWNEDIEENIFDFIRNSLDYQYAVNNKYYQVDIYLDET